MGAVPAGDEICPPDATRAAGAVELAARLLRAAAADTNRGERRRAERLGRLLADEQGRAPVFKLDLALDGPVPLANREATRSGTIHHGARFQRTDCCGVPLSDLP